MNKCGLVQCHLVKDDTLAVLYFGDLSCRRGDDAVYRGCVVMTPYYSSSFSYEDAL